MAIPSFRKRRTAASIDKGDKHGAQPKDQSNVRSATKTRRNTIIAASFFYLVSVIFLILVEIGNTDGSHVRGDIFFFRLELADIMPSSVSGLGPVSLTNSIARTLGLHDFYQVGLWNFCEGYRDEGITACSTPSRLYWFNPIEIVRSELLAGATIALPSEVNTILTILRVASQVMFGFFMASLVVNFVLMLISLIVIRSRWYSLPIALLAGASALMVIGAAAVGTAMALIFKYALTSQVELNVGVDIGTKMFAFMWISAGFTTLSFLLHAGMGCCCASQRDLRTGRKGTKRTAASPVSSEKPKRGYKLPIFGKKSASSGSTV